MTKEIIPHTDLIEIDQEPRMRDIELAEYLGFIRPADIRDLIARNRDELETYGNFPCRAEKSNGRGRPGKAYYLNEGQALVICALSRTARAAEVRKMLITVFMAHRESKVVHVKEHRRRRPNIGKGSPAFEEMFPLTLECVQASTADPYRMMASMLARLLLLERELGAR